jgi:hypothetical protein
MREDYSRNMRSITKECRGRTRLTETRAPIHGSRDESRTRGPFRRHVRFRGVGQAVWMTRMVRPEGGGFKKVTDLEMRAIMASGTIPYRPINNHHEAVIYRRTLRGSRQGNFHLQPTR